VADNIKQRGRPRGVQELRAHGNATRIDARELMDDHDWRLSDDKNTLA
jgi:hypothetical protein